MLTQGIAVLTLASAIAQQSVPAPVLVPAPSSTIAPAPAPPGAPHWVRGTRVKLMVLVEVNSRTARAGDRVKLRVNEPVVVEGATAIPVGATAWGEVTSASGTGLAGGKGRLGMRLLFIETASGRVALSGSQHSEGDPNTGGVVLGVLGFGLAGLLTKGGNATFKAGDVVTGEIETGDAPVGAPLVVGG